MNSSLKLSIILLLLGLGKVQSQTVNLNCVFGLVNNVYTCQLAGITIVDNENANIVIGGTHNSGYNNAGVRRVNILNSNIPFVVRQLFTSFVNLEGLNIANGGLTRIQSNALTGASNLREFLASNNVLLQRIEANAFAGAPNLSFVDLFQNGLDSIHENAFTGLSRLEFLNADYNQIRTLPVNVFRPLTSLTAVSLGTNVLETLDGRIFENNRLLNTVLLDGNQINAMGRNLLDGLFQMSFFSILRNRCANSQWRVGGGTTLDSIRTGLNICFNNYVENPNTEVRRFVLELQGTLIIRSENGTEIGRL